MVNLLLKRFLLLLVLQLFIALSTFATDKVIKIGWIGPLSGNMAVLGVDALNAANLAVSIYNKGLAADTTQHRLQIVSEDDQYNTIKSIDAYQRLKSKGIKLFIVYNYNGLFAIAPKAAMDQTFIIDPLDCDEDIAKLPSNVICIAKMSEDFGRSVAEFLAKPENSPSAIFYWSGDAFSVKVAKSIKDYLNNQGKSPVLYEGYETSNIDFNPVILKLKNKGVKSVYFHGNDDAAIFFKRLKELKMDLIKVALANIATPDVVKIAGDSLNDIYIGNWIGKKNDRLDKFKQEFEAEYKRPPYIEVSTLPSYDVMTLLIKYFEANPDSINITDISQYFLNVKDFPGISGTISIDNDGVTRSLKTSLQQISVVNGKLTLKDVDE